MRKKPHCNKLQARPQSGSVAMSLPITDLHVNTLTRINVFVYILTDLTDIYIIHSFYNLFNPLLQKLLRQAGGKYYQEHREWNILHQLSPADWERPVTPDPFPCAIMKQWRGSYLASCSAFSRTACAIVSASWYFFLLLVSSLTESCSSAWTAVSCSMHWWRHTKKTKEWVFLVLSYWGKMEIPLSWKL